MLKCENCGKYHDGSYASGRFCSAKCSRGFSTKSNRKEIGKKISKSIKIKLLNGESVGWAKINFNLDRSNIKKICPQCNNEFEVSYYKTNQVCCSKSCSAKNMSIETRDKIRKKMIGINSGNKNGMYGKSPKNTKNIEVFSKKHTGKKVFNVRSSYEAEFVKRINRNELISKFTYEPKQYKVNYIDNLGINRTYQPDFLINDNEVIEIKNSWNSQLDETHIKEKYFRTQFPTITYKILIDF